MKDHWRQERQATLHTARSWPRLALVVFAVNSSSGAFICNSHVAGINRLRLRRPARIEHALVRYCKRHPGLHLPIEPSALCSTLCVTKPGWLPSSGIPPLRLGIIKSQTSELSFLRNTACHGDYFNLRTFL
jgi:hypothetical protein